MTKLLCFSNPGEIDPRLITLMGVNVKAKENPIGYFGTGLKYAIASVLRLGGKLVVYSGARRFEFRVDQESIRGKDFGIISMFTFEGIMEHTERLGFTTELGKNWEPAGIYRELYCNAMDEGGKVEVINGPDTCGLIAADGCETHFVVDCKELLEAHAERGKFILETPQLAAGDIATIHSGESTGIFYRGNKVNDLPAKAILSYNVQESISLTEDRTAESHYEVTQKIARATFALEDRELIRAILNAPKYSFERDAMDYDWTGLKPGAVFLEELIEHKKQVKGDMNGSLIKVLKREKPESTRPQECGVNGVEEQMLSKAKAFCEKWLGCEITYPVFVTESLGTDVYGQALGREIWIAKRAFMVGTKCVAGTLLEEQLHIATRHGDMTRGLQNWLVDKIVSLGEELAGEPI